MTSVPVSPVATPPPPPPDEGDGELVARARRGDVEAFEVLYRRTSGRVYAICLRMSGDAERAKELLQDVFVRVWERLESFRGEAAFTSWLHRLTVNVVLAQSRADQRRGNRFGTLPDDPDAGRLSDSGGGAASIGHRLDLESAIAALPPGARKVFVLHDIEGFRHEEIARLTGTAEGTVRAQLHRARKLLMEALGR
ncbi:MAG TPA: RNA polymerase sigma factor [Gemmatimonadaceae bacterium]|nr:RNA polymerase sigma factor [Gemmatimonadaceae bacterium]